MTAEELDAIRKRNELNRGAIGWNCIPRTMLGHPHQIAADIDALLAEVERLQSQDAERTGHPMIFALKSGPMTTISDPELAKAIEQIRKLPDDLSESEKEFLDSPAGPDDSTKERP